ncbi:bridging integrator 3 homolog [Dysidea avara]|uniref:bridging integrator 3 homolog n=1 Tax=Dysidea avara TaxID=196820 RepID=UPI003329F0FC
MSWNPFKKAFSPRRNRGEDAEFDSEMSKLHQEYTTTKKMYKEMKRCNEAQNALSKVRGKLGNELNSNVLSRHEPLKATVDQVNSSLSQLHKLNKDLISNQEKMFIDPLKRFCAMYGHVESQMKRREQKLQEYERQQSKLEKMEKLSPPPAKIDATQRAVTASKTEYENVHQRLMEEMPKLHHGRLSYYTPCLKSAIQSQQLYYFQCARVLEETLSHMDPIPVDEQELLQETNQLMDSFRKISIVGHQHSPTNN